MTQKIIGMLGGMSWKSSAEYYRLINEGVRDRLGGLHSARCLMWSFDFDDIAVLQRDDRWEEAAGLMVEAAQRLERGGADFLVICTNTMHKAYPQIRAAVGLPLLHIADPTAEAIRRAGLATVGLIGTRFTMEQAFYRDRLRGHGLEVLTPPPADRELVHRVVYEELCRGRVLDASRAAYRRVMADLVARGAQAVILGCTEFGMLLRAGDAPDIPRVDTTELHCQAAVDWMLGKDSGREDATSLAFSRGAPQTLTGRPA